MKFLFSLMSLLVSGVFCAAEVLEIQGAARIELYPTPWAIGCGVTLPDKNTAATAELSYREKPGFGKWLRAPDLTFDKVENAFYGSVFPCRPGTAYELRVSIRVNGKDTETAREVTTPALNIEMTAKENLYVSPCGDDNADGAKTHPLRTISRALSKCAAGTVINAEPGVYNEPLIIRNLRGNPGAPVIIKSIVPGRAVLSGAREINKNASEWKSEGDYYRADFGDAVQYLTENGLWSYQFHSLAEFVKNCPVYEESVPESKRKIPRSWFYDADTKRLYVRTAAPGGPAGQTLELSGSQFGFQLINSSHIVIDGFEIKDFSVAGIGVFNGSHDNIFTGNIIHHNSIGVTVRDCGSDNNHIYKNRIFSSGILDYDWNLIKHSSGAGKQGVLINAGRGNTVVENEIFGYFDGIQLVSWAKQERLAEINRDSDIIGNHVHDCMDDAIEPDGGGINVRILGNRIENIGNSGVSLAPVTRGPLYAVWNTALNPGWTMFKLNVGPDMPSEGAAYVYHNSSYGSQMAVCLPLFPPKGPLLENKVFKNNIFAVTKVGLFNGRPGGVLDYNCYWNIGGGTVAMFWGGRPDMFKNNPELNIFTSMPDRQKYMASILSFKEFTDLAGFSTASGQDKNSIIANPLFQNPQKGDFSIPENSPAAGRAGRIAGINDSQEKAPNIGAFQTR